jgi:superfamily II DNA/RNA helicase
LTGSLQSNDIKERISSFKGNAGILIITDVALEGITLEFVDECINYDLPLNPLKFEQRWGRLLRAGRESEFRMVVLRDLSKSLRWEEELLNKLEGTM